MGLKSPIPIQDLKFNTPIPYTIHVDRELLDITKQKLALARYPEEQTDFGPDNWTQGAKVERVKHLAEFWREGYDWDEEERRLNTIFNHFLVKVDVPGYGPIVLHYTHTTSSFPNAIPLLFCHGWPGSFVEASRVIKPLTEPENETNAAFHFIAPSIPGFGFSPAPTKSGLGPNAVARAFKTLMTDVLGYEKFVTQGGDFGSFITRSMAMQYPGVIRAQHLNMFPVAPPSLWTAPGAYLRWCLSGIMYSEFEREAVRRRAGFEMDGSGYLEMQRTRPQTVGFGLGDSPVGVLAWVVEKVHEWVDVGEAVGDGDVITLVMMHWVQGVVPGLRFYREAFGDGRREAERAFEGYVGVPTGVSMFAKEQLHCPRDWAARVANIQFWREYDRGGHFSSLERPDLFVKDLSEFFSSEVVLESFYGK
ncbi:putative hydrolases or acyltransferase [Aspergillus sclerotiicarbonarius CBS 121057]|uniref:Putative hydrolases or acyltransferase n=1 Tax=Aspergillus sclerotiicarbonarius (strain CBS 121057 / IBT 28362) TaxID=1448318 RepID=A0A319ES62_ASPSB|nr:putative hydrolases or acyltransferase [Aspergillus sclerotiicarbonarius CBS 121057]